MEHFIAIQENVCRLEVCSLKESLTITDLIPIQVIQDVDMVKGKTILVMEVLY